MKLEFDEGFEKELAKAVQKVLLQELEYGDDVAQVIKEQIKKHPVIKKTLTEAISNIASSGQVQEFTKKLAENMIARFVAEERRKK